MTAANLNLESAFCTGGIPFPEMVADAIRNLLDDMEDEGLIAIDEDTDTILVNLAHDGEEYDAPGCWVRLEAEDGDEDERTIINGEAYLPAVSSPTLDDIVQDAEKAAEEDIPHISESRLRELDEELEDQFGERFHRAVLRELAGRVWPQVHAKRLEVRDYDNAEGCALGEYSRRLHRALDEAVKEGLITEAEANKFDDTLREEFITSSDEAALVAKIGGEIGRSILSDRAEWRWAAEDLYEKQDELAEIENEYNDIVDRADL